MRRHRSCLMTLSALALAAATAPAFAGPPFRTDDPEPAENGHYELYLYSEGTHADHATEGVLPGFEINYGAGEDLQLSAAFEQGYANDDAGWHSAYAATEAGIKYRFAREDPQSWQPQISFYPSLEMPGNGGGATTFLPLWAQKTFEHWEVFGGGGYNIRRAHEQRNSWFAGIGSLFDLGESWQLGGELFFDGAETRSEHDQTGFNLALRRDFDARWHLVGSAGRGLRHADITNQFSYYLGLELTI